MPGFLPIVKFNLGEGRFVILRSVSGKNFTNSAKQFHRKLIDETGIIARLLFVLLAGILRNMTNWLFHIIGKRLQWLWFNNYGVR